MIYTPVAVFRFYASHWRGAGHAMRCMTLAQGLKKRGWDCQFVTEEESYDFLPPLQEFIRHDPENFLKNPFAHDLLVIDHYECAKEYEKFFRPYAKVIFSIDDLADRMHDCDIILDQAYGRSTDNYKQLVPQDCEILTGPAYALLRDQFSQLRDVSIKRRQEISSIQRILINFGGNDQKNMILASLKELFKVGYKGSIDIAFGLMAPHRHSVEEFAATMPNNIQYYQNPDMASLMCSADFAIGAPAVTAWERFCLGLPTLMLMTADNQSYTYAKLVADGLALGGTLNDLAQPGLLIDFNKSIYRGYVQKCADQTQGRGTYIIINKIEQKLEQYDTIQKKVS